MLKQITLLIAVVTFSLYAGGRITVVEEKPMQQKKTMIVFETENDKPAELLEHAGSTVTGNVLIVGFNQVAQIPGTVVLEPGVYNFIVDNKLPFGRTSCQINAEGGLQRWHYTPGNKSAGVSYSFMILGLTGLTTGITFAAMSPLFSDTDSWKGWLIGGLITTGISTAITIPSFKHWAKNSARIKMVEQKSASEYQVPEKENDDEKEVSEQEKEI